MISVALGDKEVQEDIEYLIDEEAKFWKCVKGGIKPPLILPNI